MEKILKKFPHCMNQILKNFPHCEMYNNQSFVGYWHEQIIWDTNSYWEFEKALYQMSRIIKRDDIPREVAWPILRIFSYIMSTVQAHYDDNDGFVIKTMDEESLYNFIERFQLVIEGFFSGKMPDNQLFSIVNPLL